MSWWHDNVEISTLSHPSADDGVQAIVNQLFIGTVTREFLGTKLQCRAQGSKMVAAVVKEVTVQVHCESLFSCCTSKTCYSLFPVLHVSDDRFVNPPPPSGRFSFRVSAFGAIFCNGLITNSLDGR